MHSVSVEPAVHQVVPDMMVGMVVAHNVDVQPHAPALWTMLDELAERLRVAFTGKVAADRPEIAATRRAYRAVGDDPTRYRPANEALLRRVLSHRQLSQVNTVVDINNYVSLESGFALGCYDAAQLHGPIVVRRGAPGEQYAPIGKPSVDAGNRLVLVDDLGIFGSPTADSQRAMVTQDARDVVFVVWGFDTSATALTHALNRLVELVVLFCGATAGEPQLIGARQ